MFPITTHTTHSFTSRYQQKKVSLLLNLTINVFYLLQESFIYVFVEKGHLKLQGQQAGQVLTPQKSGEKVSLIVR